MCRSTAASSSTFAVRKPTRKCFLLAFNYITDFVINVFVVHLVWGVDDEQHLDVTDYKRGYSYVHCEVLARGYYPALGVYLDGVHPLVCVLYLYLAVVVSLCENLLRLKLIFYRIVITGETFFCLLLLELPLLVLN